MLNIKIRLTLKSFLKSSILEAKKSLDLFLNEIKTKFNYIGLPKKKKRFCILRSPHIDKDAREHIEVITYKSFYDITIPSYFILNQLLIKELPLGISYTVETL
jgi:small subunit ribosomal protein S10